MKVDNSGKTEWIGDWQINFESGTDNNQTLNFEWKVEIIINLFAFLKWNFSLTEWISCHR